MAWREAYLELENCLVIQRLVVVKFHASERLAFLAACVPAWHTLFTVLINIHQRPYIYTVGFCLWL